MSFEPHVTVAVVCEKDGKFLFVEEISQQKKVINQPAGHVEANETLIEAALRETLEETGWQVVISHFIGVYVLDAPNGVTYYRMCFAATPLKQVTTDYDEGIIGPIWLNLEQLNARQGQLRSALVVQCVEDYLNNPAIPLSNIREFRS